MLYLLAILLPPVAVLLCGKPFQAFVNFILIFFFWVPAVIHALFVVHDKKANDRNKKLIKSLNR